MCLHTVVHMGEMVAVVGQYRNRRHVIMYTRTFVDQFWSLLFPCRPCRPPPPPSSSLCDRAIFLIPDLVRPFPVDTDRHGQALAQFHYSVYTESHNIIHSSTSTLPLHTHPVWSYAL